MGALKILLPTLPEAVRPEIPTPYIFPANRTKRDIKARLLRSSSSAQASVQAVQAVQNGKAREVDVGMERLIKAAEGPSLSKEFDDLVKALRASLNNNLEGTSTLLCSNLMDTLLTTEFKRVISLMKDNDTIIRAWKVELCVWVRERDERNAKAKAEKEEKDRKYAEEIARLEQRSNEG
ncbi:hypothetical protein AgCh_006184 [Apium graveolens]